MEPFPSAWLPWVVLVLVFWTLPWRMVLLLAAARLFIVSPILGLLAMAVWLTVELLVRKG